ncbi:MAG: hypothetical protein OXQ92_06940, partial [Boseongicola sp.]|nr:hypothetical protein [Boseongicola sp.]
YRSGQRLSLFYQAFCRISTKPLKLGTQSVTPPMARPINQKNAKAGAQLIHDCNIQVAGVSPGAVDQHKIRTLRFDDDGDVGTADIDELTFGRESSFDGRCSKIGAPINEQTKRHHRGSNYQE